LIPEKRGRLGGHKRPDEARPGIVRRGGARVRKKGGEPIGPVEKPRLHEDMSDAKKKKRVGADSAVERRVN